jgi:hypothetical protein
MRDRIPVLLFGRLGVEPVSLLCLGTFASSVRANDRLFSTHAVRLPLQYLDCWTSSRPFQARSRASVRRPVRIGASGAA